MKIILTLLISFFALSANATHIEIYQFWFTNFGYTCNTSKAIIEEIVKEKYPDVKFEIIDLNEQTSNSVVPSSYISRKAVAILNTKTGKHHISNIRQLIGQQKSKEQIKQSFITEIENVINSK